MMRRCFFSNEVIISNFVSVQLDCKFDNTTKKVDEKPEIFGSMAEIDDWVCCFPKKIPQNVPMDT